MASCHDNNINVTLELRHEKLTLGNFFGHIPYEVRPMGRVCKNTREDRNARLTDTMFGRTSTACDMVLATRVVGSIHHSPQKKVGESKCNSKTYDQ